MLLLTFTGCCCRDCACEESSSLERDMPVRAPGLTPIPCFKFATDAEISRKSRFILIVETFTVVGVDGTESFVVAATVEAMGVVTDGVGVGTTESGGGIDLVSSSVGERVRGDELSKDSIERCRDCRVGLGTLIVAHTSAFSTSPSLWLT